MVAPGVILVTTTLCVFSETPTQGQFLPGLGWEFMIFSKAHEGQGGSHPPTKAVSSHQIKCCGWLGPGGGTEAKSRAYPDTGCHCPE